MNIFYLNDKTKITIKCLIQEHSLISGETVSETSESEIHSVSPNHHDGTINNG